jgi:hypothetical protein
VFDSRDEQGLDTSRFASICSLSQPKRVMVYNKQWFCSCSWVDLTCSSIFTGADFWDYFDIKTTGNDSAEYGKNRRRFWQNTLGCRTLHTRKLYKNDAYFLYSNANIDTFI